MGALELDARAPSGAPAPARIGPNAIIQMRAAMIERLGMREAGRILAAAGLGPYVFSPPTEMVDEREVAALHRALRAGVGQARAAEIAFEAGRRTGLYLLAHRIPKPVALLLRLAPPALASRLLLGAVARHAWTFAGSGRFSVEATSPAILRIEGCPIVGRGERLTQPGCAFYCGTFEALFRALVHRRARARQTACEALGHAACLFEISWSGRGPA